MTTAVPPCFTRASRRRAFESTAILRRCHGRARLRLSRDLGGAALRPCSAPPSAPHHTSRGSLRRISELTLLFTAFMVAFHFPTSITAPAFFVKLEQKAKKPFGQKFFTICFKSRHQLIPECAILQSQAGTEQTLRSIPKTPSKFETLLSSFSSLFYLWAPPPFGDGAFRFFMAPFFTGNLCRRVV